MESWKNSHKYTDMLTLMGSLSGLFADSEIPFIYYRATENLFCKYCSAKNLARDDSAYDAKINNVGIGIKTFQVSSGHSIEKIAEFNKLSPSLRALSGMDLACKLAEYRNERMKVANDLYGIKQSVYHIIGRNVGQLEVFDTPYDFIDTPHIVVTAENEKSLHFHDDKHQYVFNRSKSVLMKKFIVPANPLILPVNIIKDPYALLETLLLNKEAVTVSVESRNSVILPLFSVLGRKGNKQRYVPEKSGLNQWNASGRARDYDEVYIPVPAYIQHEYQGFFPPRDTPFVLHLPDDTKTMSAKICQDGGKALMSNPNKALGEWILRQVLHLQHGELLTYEKLLRSGFDSLRITKVSSYDYYVDITTKSYDQYDE